MKLNRGFPFFQPRMILLKYLFSILALTLELIIFVRLGDIAPLKWCVKQKILYFEIILLFIKPTYR
jgi:hypothetical protein